MYAWHACTTSACLQPCRDLLAGEARLGEGGRDERCLDMGIRTMVGQSGGGLGLDWYVCVYIPLRAARCLLVEESRTLGEAEAGEEGGASLHFLRGGCGLFCGV